MAADITFRDYQLEAIRSVFDDCGLRPAGPPTDEIVAYCCGHRAREDGDNGGTGEELAEGACDDDLPPF